MRIAFYAPLKSPRHPVPSGDRLMARLIIRALEAAGHSVELASELRSFSKDPQSLPHLAKEAAAERERIAARWRDHGVPDLWFCYHPYYKAPDLIGPDLSRSCGIPYVTAEASYSLRRNEQGWHENQDLVLASVRQAAVNLCMTERDRKGLLEVAPDARTERLPPFIDSASFEAREPDPVAGRLVTVAMMRPGDKKESYAALAAALRLVDRPFHLRIAGDGPARNEIVARFSGLPVDFLGESSPDRIAAELSRASLFVWPGCGEAYGLAYLEAQAAGLPVVAFDTAGVPEVVENGMTGLLTPPGDAAAYAEAVSGLLADPVRCAEMGRAARAFVLGERRLQQAAARLATLLKPLGRMS